jgi:hypothetical protein
VSSWNEAEVAEERQHPQAALLLELVLERARPTTMLLRVARLAALEEQQQQGYLPAAVVVAVEEAVARS